MAPALGLGLLLGLLGGLGDATKVLHSLRYLEVAVSESSLGIPQFMSIGYLDGIPFTRYDSERGRAEPLTQWMKDGVKPGYWDGQTQLCVKNQDAYAWNLETLLERYNQSRGLHTALQVYGCDLLSDGSVRGSERYSYDGRDFLSFDLESRRFLAADSAAEITRRHWEEENEAERWTNYLEHVCPEWLQKYVGYGQKELDRKENLTPESGRALQETPRAVGDRGEGDRTAEKSGEKAGGRGSGLVRGNARQCGCGDGNGNPGSAGKLHGKFAGSTATATALAPSRERAENTKPRSVSDRDTEPRYRGKVALFQGKTDSKGEKLMFCKVKGEKFNSF